MELSDKINEAITNYGLGLSSSMVYLLKYGGEVYGEDFKLDISPENKRQLRDRIVDIKETTDKLKPRLGLVVNTFTGCKVTYDSPKKKGATELKVRPFKDLRAILRESYETHKRKIEEPLDKITLTHLFDREEKLPPNTHVEFGHQKNCFIYGLRIKQKENYLNKLRIKWGALSKKDKSRFPEFIAEVASVSYNYWEPEHHSEFYNEFGRKLNETLLGDVVGFRIVDIGPKNAEKNINKLKNNLLGKGRSIPGFYILPETFDDHTERLKDKRPGGIHVTLVDRGHTNFPIEVQYWSLTSQIYDLFGPHARALYEVRGKKQDPRYKKTTKQ
ncbi:hypothetical protein GOV05_04180 [Candidatus Woesearchaeota archaeon]|nr:hypothetical protein [Candidatus Woesearchaeota archaeon]